MEYRVHFMRHSRTNSFVKSYEPFVNNFVRTDNFLYKNLCLLAAAIKSDNLVSQHAMSLTPRTSNFE